MPSWRAGRDLLSRISPIPGRCLLCSATEARYPTQKLPALRRAPLDVVRKFHSDFEKRLKSGYVMRMLASDDFAFAQPVIDGVREAYARWHSCFDGSAIPD